jgi:hypothetical protein
MFDGGRTISSVASGGDVHQGQQRVVGERERVGERRRGGHGVLGRVPAARGEISEVEGRDGRRDRGAFDQTPVLIVMCLMTV